MATKTKKKRTAKNKEKINWMFFFSKMEEILSIMLGLGVLGALVALLGRSWNALKEVSRRLGSFSGRFWAVLGRSWVVLGRSWDPLGRILGRLGGILGKISKKGRG